MKRFLSFLSLILLFFFLLIPAKTIFAAGEDTVAYFFDLRDRETFIQLTYETSPLEDPPGEFVPGQDLRVHIQIFNVDQDCNENNFFDVYTPNDTHVYNMRNILTNDGNPSGVVLPDGSYGFVFALVVNSQGQLFEDVEVLIGNLRVLDDNGYEYRTNAQAGDTFEDGLEDPLSFFNFNSESGVILSDIVGIGFDDDFNSGEVVVNDQFSVINIDIFNNNEVVFSCRDIIYACINENSPLLEDLLEQAADETSGSASVARAEYGINDVIPHSKGGELLCPGNNISEGFVRMELLNEDSDDFALFVGLNNGNGRGSMFIAVSEFFEDE